MPHPERKEKPFYHYFRIFISEFFQSLDRKTAIFGQFGLKIPLFFSARFVHPPERRKSG
jgi:hypothetical protein